MNYPREKPIEYQQQYEAIDAPERIFSLLKHVIGNETSLKIVPDNGDELFQTSLQTIDYDRKLLSLKKIAYTFGHLMVIDSKTLTVYTQRDGAEVSFTTYLKRYSDKNGGIYEIRFPEQVKYRQRRMSHRVHLSFAMNITAEFYGDKGQKFQGHLRDISNDGMRLQFSSVNPMEFREKSLIKNCLISLPNREPMNCNLQIQHKHGHVRNTGCTIGASFYQMSIEQKKEIQKFIAGLERRLLREVRI